MAENIVTVMCVEFVWSQVCTYNTNQGLYAFEEPEARAWWLIKSIETLFSVSG